MTSNTQEKLEQILEYSIGLVESGKNVRYKKHNDIGFYNKNKFVFEINNESPRLFFNRDDFYLNGARVAYQALENISNDIIVDLVPKSSEELDKIIYAYQYTSNEDDFVSKLNEGREESNKMGYDFFRSLLLLKILEKHPDKANEVQENSIFFPQRLFVSHKLAKDKKKQQEIELASSILEIFSSDMVDRITKYNNLVNKSVRGDNWENFRESKYASMFKRNDECTDEEISRLYDTISVKRDIIKTLYDSLSVFGKLNNYKSNIKKLSKNLRISMGFFNTSRDYLERYAKNQILTVFEDKNVAISTYLSRLLGFKSYVGDDERLYIKHGMRTSNFFRGNKKFNTSTELLTVVHVLNKLYFDAIDVLREENEEESRE